MRQKFRMFLRGTVYWVQDNFTGKQESLRTKDRIEAKRLFNAKNEARIRRRTFVLSSTRGGEVWG